jgi:cytoskeleton protein RodZ
VDTGIGATLHEARNRRKIELSEVEAAIKIRVRYLLAIENEEWDVLPGVAYARGFIRTYAYYLGLDGERLADEYRHGVAPPGGDRVPKRVEPVPAAPPRSESRLSGRALVVAVCLVLVALAVGIGLVGGDEDPPSSSPPVGRAEEGTREAQAPAVNSVARRGVAVELTATGEVWVCLLDARRQPLVDGEILAAGAEAGPFRSDGFEIALGNGSAEIFVDDERAEIPPSSSPVGYRIDSGGELIALEEGERPDCE